MIEPQAYMASVDLKDAFYSIPIIESDQKYLKFFVDSYFQIVCMSNGYSESMRVLPRFCSHLFVLLGNKGTFLWYM